MFQTKVTFSENQTPEQRKAHAANWRREDERRRTINNAFGFWRICSKPVCRRNRTCSHDMHACFERHWRPIPEDQKEWVRGAIVAKSGGATGEAVLRAVRSICNCRSGRTRVRSRWLHRQARTAAMRLQHRTRGSGGCDAIHVVCRLVGIDAIAGAVNNRKDNDLLGIDIDSIDYDVGPFEQFLVCLRRDRGGPCPQAQKC